MEDWFISLKEGDFEKIKILCEKNTKLTLEKDVFIFFFKIFILLNKN
jgi:hypothetical protein